MNLITPEQQRAVAAAGDSPVELADPGTGNSYVLLHAEDYRRLLGEAEDRTELDSWARLARKAREARASEDSD